MNILKSFDIFYRPTTFNQEKNAFKAFILILVIITITIFAVKDMYQNLFLNQKVTAILDLGQMPITLLDKPGFNFDFKVYVEDQSLLIGNQSCILQLLLTKTDRDVEIINYKNITKSDSKDFYVVQFETIEFNETRFNLSNYKNRLFIQELEIGLEFMINCNQYNKKGKKDYELTHKYNEEIIKYHKKMI